MEATYDQDEFPSKFKDLLIATTLNTPPMMVRWLWHALPEFKRDG